MQARLLKRLSANRIYCNLKLCNQFLSFLDTEIVIYYVIFLLDGREQNGGLIFEIDFFGQLSSVGASVTAPPPYPRAVMKPES